MGANSRVERVESVEMACAQPRSSWLFRNPVSKESIVIERAGAPGRIERGEARGRLPGATTKSLIICRKLSEGLRDVERDFEPFGRPASASHASPVRQRSLSFVFHEGRGHGVQRECNASVPDRLFPVLRHDDKMLLKQWAEEIINKNMQNELEKQEEKKKEGEKKKKKRNVR